MTNSPVTLLAILLVFGFLSGSTIYFYNKSKVDSPTSSKSVKFDAQLPQDSSGPSKVDQNTQPAEPKGRLSYPANIYKVQPKESLYSIGEKLGVSYTTIKAANGLKDENLIQADYPLVIPKLSKETDYYRVNFLINDEKAAELNRTLAKEDKSDWYDPTLVAKQNASPYFGITDTDNFRLIEADYSHGTAVVEAKTDAHTNIVGLIQPKTKGQKGLWALYYVESRD